MSDIEAPAWFPEYMEKLLFSSIRSVHDGLRNPDCLLVTVIIRADGYGAESVAIASDEQELSTVLDLARTHAEFHGRFKKETKQ